MARLERGVRAVSARRWMATAIAAGRSGVGRAVRAGGERPGQVRLVLAVFVVVLAVGAGLLWWQDQRHDAVEQAREEATAAAAGHLVAALSYDYRSFDSDVERARLGLTGTFLDDFSRLMNSVVAPAARDQQIVTAATVVRSAIVSAEPERVVVLAFVNQTTTSARATGSEVSGSRVRLTLVEVDGRWLTSDLTPV